MVYSGNNLVKIGKQESSASPIVELFDQFTAQAATFQMSDRFSCRKHGEQQDFVRQQQGIHKFRKQGDRANDLVWLECSKDSAAWKRVSSGF